MVARAEGELHRWSLLPPCTPQPDACPPVLVGAGGWNLGFRDQNWGEDWGWLCGDRLRGLESSATVVGGVLRGSLGCLETSHHCLGGARGEELGTDCSLFPCAHARRGQDTACMGFRGCREMPLPLARTRGVVVGPCASPSDPRNVHEPLLPTLQTPGVVASCLHSHRVLQGHA